MLSFIYTAAGIPYPSSVSEPIHLLVVTYCHILFYPYYIGQLCLLFTCRPLRRLNNLSPGLNQESFYKSNGPNVELSYNKCSADLKSIKLFTIFAFNYNLLDKRKDLMAPPESTKNWSRGQCITKKYFEIMAKTQSSIIIMYWNQSSLFF